MKILAADDHQLIVDDLLDEISNIIPEAECMGTSDPEEVLPLFEEHGFDVVFMDIDMPGVNGITLAKKILAKAPRTNIIYITGYEKYAIDSYETFASAFLVKPVSTENLRNALENLRFPVSEITDDMIEAQCSGDSVLGARMKKYREERNISPNELSEIMNVTLQTVYRWEKGVRIPDITTLMKLARLYGVSVDDFIKT